MPDATLRSVGGSVVLSIPKKLLDLVNLHAGSRVTVNVQDNTIIIANQRKRRYTLNELIERCAANSDPKLSAKE